MLRSKRTHQLISKKIEKKMERHELIYRLPVTTPYYSHEYSPNIDPIRAQQGLPCYLHISNGTTTGIKKVIFNDWRYKYLLPFIDPFTKMYSDCLYCLAECEIYYWDGKELVQTKDFQHFLATSSLMQPISTKKLKEMIQLKNFTLTQTHLLDYGQANASFISATIDYVDNEYSRLNYQYDLHKLKNTLFLRDIINAPPCHLPKILAWLKEESQNFQILDITVCNFKDHDNEFPLEIQSQLIKDVCNILTSVHTLYIRYTEDFERYFPHIPDNALRQIKTVMISGKIDEKSIPLLKKWHDLLQEKNITFQIIFAKVENEAWLLLLQATLPQWKVSIDSKYSNIEYPIGFFVCSTQPNINNVTAAPLLAKLASSYANSNGWGRIEGRSVNLDNNGMFYIHDDGRTQPLPILAYHQLFNEIRLYKSINRLVIKNVRFDRGDYQTNPNISCMTIDNCQFQPFAVVDFLQAFTHLAHLELENDLTHLFSKIPLPQLQQLQSLKLSWDRWYPKKIDLIPLVYTLLKTSRLNILRLDLFGQLLLDNLAEEFDDSIEELCPNLVHFELCFDETTRNESVDWILKRLPKNLKWLEIGVVAFMSDSRAKSLRALIEKHFTSLDVYLLNHWEKSKVTESKTVEYLPKKTLVLDGNTDSTEAPPIAHLFLPNPAAKFNPRHTRDNFYQYDPFKKSIELLKPAFLQNIWNVTQEECKDSVYFVKDTFYKNFHIKEPFIYMSEAVQIPANAISEHWLESPGPRSVIAEGQNKKPLFGCSHPLMLSYWKETGKYRISIKSTEAFTLYLNAIFCAPRCAYPLYKILDIKYAESFKNIKFLEKGQLDVTTVDTRLKTYSDSSDKLLNAMIHFFRGFHPKTIESKGLSKTELSNTLLEQQAGVCRHRARLFATLANAFEIPFDVRIPQNASHEWIEIRKKINDNTMQVDDFSQNEHKPNLWYRVELFPSRKKYKTKPNQYSDRTQSFCPFNPDWSEDEYEEMEQETKLPIAEKPRVVAEFLKTVPQLPVDRPEIFFEALDQLLNSVLNKQALIVLPDASDRFAFYHYLYRYHKNKKLCTLDDLDNVMQKDISVDPSQKMKLIFAKAHRFLKEAKSGDMLIMNFMEMKPQHMGYNSVIDLTQRILDGTPVPTGVHVIAVTHFVRFLSLREDIISRFPRTEGLLIQVPSWPITLPDLKNEEAIHLDERSDWLNYLIADKKIVNGNLISNKGLLIDMLQQPLVFNNPPEQDDSFNLFAATGEYEYNGLTYRWQEPIRTAKCSYSFPTEAICTVNPNEEPAIIMETPTSYCKQWILNRTTYRYLQKTSFYDEKNHKTALAPSMLEQLSSDSILIVTDEMSNGKWNFLLKQCKALNKKFYFQRLNNHSVPKELKPLLQESKLPYFENPFFNVIQCQDPSYVIAKFRHDNPLCFALGRDLNTGLIERWEILKDTMQTEEISLPEFSLHPGDLLNALEAGRTVILYGTLSDDLQNLLLGLASDNPYLMFNGAPYRITKGKVIVIVNTEDDFSVINKRTLVEPSLKDKLTLIAPDSKYTSQFNAFSTMIAKNIFIEEPAYETLLLAWQYFLQQMHITKPLTDPNARIKHLLESLKVARTIYLSGPSELEIYSTILTLNKSGCFIFSRLEKIREWAEESKQNETRILYLPDGETLLGIHDPIEPHIVLEGKRIVLKPYHKIIIVQNDIDKTVCAGPIIQFGELSFDELFNNYTAPLLAPSFKEQYFQTIIKVFQNAYQHSKKQGTKLLSHHFETIAIFINTYLNTPSPPKNPDQWIDKAGIDVMKYVIQIKQNYNENPELHKRLMQQKFFLTPNHYPTIMGLQELLSVRSFNQNRPHQNPVGARGLLITGPSGIGKSSVVVSYLKMRGFKEADNQSEGSNYFVVLTPTQPQKILEILTKAFHRGWIVIIDEINTLSIEPWLTAFFLGVDLNNRPANVPGFALIGTMNPGDFPGRIPLSKELRSLFNEITMNDYNKNDIKNIIQFNFPNLQNLDFLAELYIQSKLGSDIPFTLRDILRIARKNSLCGKEEKQQPPQLCQTSSMDQPVKMDTQAPRPANGVHGMFAGAKRNITETVSPNVIVAENAEEAEHTAKRQKT